MQPPPEAEEFRDCVKIGSHRRKWIVGANVWEKYGSMVSVKMADFFVGIFFILCRGFFVQWRLFLIEIRKWIYTEVCFILFSILIFSLHFFVLNYADLIEVSWMEIGMNKFTLFSFLFYDKFELSKLVIFF